MQLKHREVLALLVAAAGLGSHLIALGPLWKWALWGGVLVAAGSFIQRAGWKAAP